MGRLKYTTLTYLNLNQPSKVMTMQCRISYLIINLKPYTHVDLIVLSGYGNDSNDYLHPIFIHFLHYITTDNLMLQKSINNYQMDHTDYETVDPNITDSNEKDYEIVIDETGKKRRRKRRKLRVRKHSPEYY